MCVCVRVHVHVHMHVFIVSRVIKEVWLNKQFYSDIIGLKSVKNKGSEIWAQAIKWGYYEMIGFAVQDC